MPTEKRQRKKEGQQARREAALAAARRQQRKRRLITFAVIIVAVVAGMFLVSATGDKKGDKKTESKATTAKATKPTITAPKGPAPTTLRSKDLKVGTGRAIEDGDTAVVNYVGVTYADGKQFDASWDRGKPFSFQLGAGGVIKGWDEGVKGMKVGGRRQLEIPGSLAYGDTDNGDGRPVGPLVFVIDLVAIK